MKSGFVRSIALVVLITFIFSACASLPPPGTALTDEERASAKKSCIAKYTALGAVGGAALGYLLGSKKSKLETTAIGAVAGGALAFAIAYGKCLALYSDLKSYPVAGFKQTAQNIGYSSSQGDVIKIQNFSVDPSGVAPGGKLALNGSYYIMAPEGTKEVKVTESRSLHYLDPSENEWKELGVVDNEITSALGTRKADGNVDVGKEMPEGKYRVTFKVAALGKEDQVTQDLTVKKGLAMGPRNVRPQHQQVAYAGTEQTGAKSITNQPKAAKNMSSLEVISKTLNVRKEPTSKAGILATIKQGEVYQIITNTTLEQLKWYQIRLDDGTEGWVPGKHVKLME
jgi:hypothetical protein